MENNNLNGIPFENFEENIHKAHENKLNHINEMFEKADQYREGEEKDYKDGRYRYEGGHWKKINNKLEGKQKEELEWKKNVEGDYEAYKDNNYFYIYHPNSDFYLKINDKHIVKGTLAVCKAAVRDFLKNNKQESIEEETERRIKEGKEEYNKRVEGMKDRGKELLKEASDIYDKHFNKEFKTKEQFLKDVEEEPEYLEDVKRDLGIDQPAEVKPKAKVIGENGNVFVTLGISSKALERAGQKDKAKEMRDRVFKSGSYHEALNIMQEYVDFE